MRIVVAGGTGLVGRYVVTSLIDAGHDPVVLSRTQGVDLASGAGLDRMLTDAQVLVDVSNVHTLRRGRSVEFFTASTGNLQKAGAKAGVRHHVVLSIVGVDRIDSGYYAGKRRQEELAMAGPIDATVLRSARPSVTCHSRRTPVPSYGRADRLRPCATALGTERRADP